MELKLFRAFVVLAGSTGLTLHLAEEFILVSADYADTTEFEHDYEVLSRIGIQYGGGDIMRENGVACFFILFYIMFIWSGGYHWLLVFYCTGVFVRCMGSA